MGWRLTEDFRIRALLTSARLPDHDLRLRVSDVCSSAKYKPSAWRRRLEAEL